MIDFLLSSYMLEFILPFKFRLMNNNGQDNNHNDNTCLPSPANFYL